METPLAPQLTAAKSKKEKKRSKCCEMGLGVSVEVRRCASLSEDEMRQLYGFSNELMAESADSFLNHMEQYDLAFIFREKSESSTSGAKKAVGRLVGLSVWRTMDTDNSWVKVIVQGPKINVLH